MCSIVLHRAIRFIVINNKIKHTNCIIVLLSFMVQSMFVVEVIKCEPVHEIYKNVVCATSKA